MLIFLTWTFFSNTAPVLLETGLFLIGRGVGPLGGLKRPSSHLPPSCVVKVRGKNSGESVRPTLPLGDVRDYIVFSASLRDTNFLFFWKLCTD